MNALQKTLIERYAEKKFNSRNFTYRDYLSLRKKLTDKNIKDDTTIIKTQAKVDRLQNLPDTRIPTDSQEYNISDVSVLATIAATTGLASLSDMEIPAIIVTGAVAGITLGAVAGAVNVSAYKNKPLSNAITKAVIKSNKGKIKRLSHRHELRDYTLYCFRQQEREKTPTYDDFLKAVRDNYDEITM